MSIKVTIRTADDPGLAQVKSGPELQELAMRWSYKLRHRSRWITKRDARANIAQEARNDLRNQGIDAKQLRTIAKSEIVEVSIPFEKEEIGWEARIMPWEYLLSAATREVRKGESLTVVRHLHKGRSSNRIPEPKMLAIVEAAPGVLHDEFDFTAEKRIIKRTLYPLAVRAIDNPSPADLRAQIEKISPDVIHLTGIDTRLGNRLLKRREEPFDGIYLFDPVNGLVAVGAEDLAKRLNAGNPRPEFIGFNCWDSGARIAPLAVAHGARAALGFQNTFDDDVAELFFLNFYRTCVAKNWDYLAAYLVAWESIRPFRHRIRGSGIILWAANSLVRRRKSPKWMQATKEEAQRVRTEARDLSKKRKEEQEPAAPEKHQIKQLVSVSVEVADCLNYASLHNQGSLLRQTGLFKSLKFRFLPQPEPQEGDEASKTQVGRVDDIEVKVLLNVGTDSFPYQTKISIAAEDGVIDLATFDPETLPARDNPPGGIRVPLTSELARSVDERMQTNILVEMRWHGQLLHQHTYAVWLNPVDEWRLNDDEIIWLPSFVQPRDPAVPRIIDTAQQFLKCLADYSSAGFDGYQSYDSDARGIKKWDGIDDQVRAIWTAISFEMALHYINPPPSYSESAQRLRRPHQTIAQGRGTCVDLAILFASCLEWIEVYPVIFMLDDHAFPGYWKSLEAYEEFIVPSGVDEEDAAGRTSEAVETTEDAPRWIAPRDSYREIRKYVHEGTLVPLETVGLTSKDSFADARETAFEYFKNLRHRTFHSMVDIIRSRAVVTPLPVFFDSDER